MPDDIDTPPVRTCVSELCDINPRELKERT